MITFKDSTPPILPSGWRICYPSLTYSTIQQTQLLTCHIGRGSTSRVYKSIEQTTKQLYAIKVLNTQSKNMKEINIHKHINKHPNIVTLSNYVISDRFTFLIMELCSHGSLNKFHGRDQRIPETIAKTYFRQIISALQYMHKKGVYHRDIKMQNVLLSHDNTVKLSDFGMSISKDNEIRKRPQSIGSTPNYNSPENLGLCPKDSFIHGEYVDRWALGVLLYRMLVGQCPFEYKLTKNDQRLLDIEELYERIRQLNYVFPHDCLQWMSSYAIDLINKVLCLNPQDRMTLDDLQNHPFMLDYREKCMKDIILRNLQYNTMLGFV